MRWLGGSHLFWDWRPRCAACDTEIRPRGFGLRGGDARSFKQISDAPVYAPVYAHRVTLGDLSRRGIYTLGSHLLFCGENYKKKKKKVRAFNRACTLISIACRLKCSNVDAQACTRMRGRTHTHTHTHTRTCAHTLARAQMQFRHN